eukprot:31377-Pelagococcus_subviridis.AAC.7
MGEAKRLGFARWERGGRGARTAGGRAPRLGSIARRVASRGRPSSRRARRRVAIARDDDDDGEGEGERRGEARRRVGRARRRRRTPEDRGWPRTRRCS